MQASSLQKKAVVKSAAQNLPFHLSSGFWWSLPASALVSCGKPQFSTDETIAEKGFHSRSHQSDFIASKMKYSRDQRGTSASGMEKKALP